MTTENVLKVYDDAKLHGYLLDFARSNLRADKYQGFVADVWCDIGMLAEECPSLHCIAEVVWRRMIQYEPILKRLADGYTQDELAEEVGRDQSNISRKLRRMAHKSR